MQNAHSSPVGRHFSERPAFKKTFVTIFVISMSLVGTSFENLAQASERMTILNYFCTTYESARQVAVEQSWETSKNMPNDCHTLFQLPFERRVAEILRVIEIIAVGDGRWAEIGRVRRGSVETGYSAGLAVDLFLF